MRPPKPLGPSQHGAPCLVPRLSDRIPTSWPAVILTRQSVVTPLGRPQTGDDLDPDLNQALMDVLRQELGGKAGDGGDLDADSPIG